MRRFLPSFTGVFVLAALLVQSVGAVETKRVEATIPSGDRVVIENIAGKIELAPVSGSDITVEATVFAEGRNEQETDRLLDAMVWNEERGSWGLDYPVGEYSGFAYPEDGSWGSTTSTRYRGLKVKVYGRPRGSAPLLYADLVIGVPAAARLRVDNAAGSVEGGRLSGELVIDTGRGDVRLATFDGRLDVDTGSGEVELRQITGELRVDTGSGRVRVSDVDVRRLDIDTGSGGVRIADGRAESAIVDTGSGDIELEGVDVEHFEGDTGSGDVFLQGDLSAARSVRVDTGSGNVTIVGGPQFEFDLRADLGSGRVRVAYDDAKLRTRDREVVGAIRGSGRTRVDVDTGSGDCRLRSSY